MGEVKQLVCQMLVMKLLCSSDMVTTMREPFKLFEHKFRQLNFGVPIISDIKFPVKI